MAALVAYKPNVAGDERFLDNFYGDVPPRCAATCRSRCSGIASQGPAAGAPRAAIMDDAPAAYGLPGSLRDIDFTNVRKSQPRRAGVIPSGRRIARAFAARSSRKRRRIRRGDRDHLPRPRRRQDGEPTHRGRAARIDLFSVSRLLWTMREAPHHMPRAHRATGVVGRRGRCRVDTIVSCPGSSSRRSIPQKLADKLRGAARQIHDEMAVGWSRSYARCFDCVFGG